MNERDSYAEILRALGRFLDNAKAVDAEIIEHSTFMAVSWNKSDDSPPTETKRAYNQLGLDGLRAQARRMRRKSEASARPGDLSGLLRTLGQKLDAMEFDLTRIQESEDGFTVTGTAEKLYQSLYIRKSDLRIEGMGGRARRSSVEYPENRGWRFWQR